MNPRTQPRSARERQQASRSRRRQIRPPPLTGAERQARFRERRSANSRVHANPLNSTNWHDSTEYFNKTFFSDDFGHICGVCDRLWFRNDLKPVRNQHLPILEEVFGEEAAIYLLCASCYESLNKRILPPLSSTNGFAYPPKPTHLPPLNIICERLISPRFPFMNIRRLRRDGNFCITGQVINVPVDVDTMVRSLPRRLDDDYAFNVCLKRKLIHKSSYLEGVVTKRLLKVWLEYMLKTPLYRHFNITLNNSFLEGESEVSCDDQIERLDDNEDSLVARQHTLLLNEDSILEVAPGQNSSPLNIIFDDYAEELSFPDIYYGVGRNFKQGVRVTPYMIATSEIRRRDRRGVKPSHILYQAMKIIRHRAVEGLSRTFRCISQTDKITRRMIESQEFLDECVERNLSFLKSIPNSAHYWSSRKKDLFAMIRQLGKPACFLTISANEINWPNLLSILQRFREESSGNSSINPSNLSRSERCRIVSEDPVICCIYFKKLLDTFMRMLNSKRNYNPFGRYRVKDYFLRIEFQQRGSPHAHVLLWIENDPSEAVSEYMPKTIQLANDLCSVSQSDLEPMKYMNQIHRHTFTCTKNGQKTCRFNIPYWPMKETLILLPLPKDHERLSWCHMRAKKCKENLSLKTYDSIDNFLSDNGLEESTYLDVIRSSLTRPTLLFKRDMTQLMTNTFHPWIADALNSNMDIQVILDEYSCASYVVDYINKSNRGSGNLQRELINLSESHPEMTYNNLLKILGKKILNSIELSAPEAAWFLLGQDMSHGSRKTVYIPTCWPWERQKAYKHRDALKKVDLDSTDIWTKSIIEKYEDRPDDLEPICLADFVAWWEPKKNPRGNQSGIDEAEGNTYRRRLFSAVIRYRSYDQSKTDEHRREMVTLFLPFRNEAVQIIDRNSFLKLYDDNLHAIAAKREEYDKLANFEQIIEEYRRMHALIDDEPAPDPAVRREDFVRSVLQNGQTENFDDINLSARSISCVGKRANVMSKIDYCKLMRSTNVKQRELILDVIDRIHSSTDRPLQMFFTGPAGCGKTYVLNLLMQTYNRYTQDRNNCNNAYVACASTGKAAVNLAGTTVHSAFRITQSRRKDSLGTETLLEYRRSFCGVRCVIVDEVSMVSSDILHRIHHRLQEITGRLEANFGNIDIIFCGDFRQLPPVRANPVYRGDRNQLGRLILWQSLDYFALDQVMRQNDKVFSSILTKLGDGLPFRPNEAQLIESRFRTSEWCKQNLQGVVRLFHQNRLVDEYNCSVILDGTDHVADDLIVGYRENSELQAARGRLHKLSLVETGGLPYCLKLAVGYPYMITTNIDVEDGLVNGALGTIRFIEVLDTVQEQAGVSIPKRIWIEFSQKTIGAKARIKVCSIIRARPELNHDLTPIISRSCNINLGGHIKCRRSQLPLTPASAITIHKSQGGTFDKVVVLYEKSQPNQLVYVAMSRVTSLEGLYLMNLENDFTFYHKFGCEAPSVREIRNEYERLARHPLDTLTSRVKSFIKTKETEVSIIVCAMNAQSLVAHHIDIETDEVLIMSDILMISETWFSSNECSTIKNFEMIAKCNRRSTPGVNEDHRTAGGVAIFLKTDKNSLQYSITHDSSTHSSGLEATDHGEFAWTVIKVMRSELLMIVIYLHHHLNPSQIRGFLTNSLSSIPSRAMKDAILISGDFNIDIRQQEWFIEFMRAEFNLEYVDSGNSPSTLGNTCIDLNFVRNLKAECRPFISYFSYHKPMILKLEIE